MATFKWSSRKSRPHLPEIAENVENTINELRVSGKQVKINKLVSWSELKGIKPDSKARSEYAAFLVQQRRN